MNINESISNKIEKLLNIIDDDISHKGTSEEVRPTNLSAEIQYMNRDNAFKKVIKRIILSNSSYINVDDNDVGIYVTKVYRNIRGVTGDNIEQNHYLTHKQLKRILKKYHDND